MKQYHERVDRRGVVLIVVLVIVVMIALAGFGFVNAMSTEYEAARIAGDEMQAEQALLSAEACIQNYLRMSAAERELAGGHFNNEMFFRGVPLSGDPEATTDESLAAETWEFSILAPAMDPLAERSGGSRSFRFGLENESNKLNLAAILKWDQQQPGAGRGVLLKLPGMTPSLADTILDWIDADEMPREFGAESPADASSAVAYKNANRLPATLDELLLVPGVSRELLFGSDTNRNYRIDDDERVAIPSASDSSDFTSGGSENVSWSDMLTLHSAERNLTRDGLPRINLNDSDLAALTADLLVVYPAEVANFITFYRQHGPSLAQSNAITAEGVTIDFSQPPRFRINSPADLIDVFVTIPGDPAVSVNSPLRSGGDDLRELLPRLLTETTTSPSAVVSARLNVNSATESVLRALPFWSEETVGQIVSRRTTPDDEANQSVAWLLTDGILGIESFKQVQPWITGGGDVFQCQVVVFRRSRGPIRRMRLLFDGASADPRRVEWQDLRSRGRGFATGSLSQASDVDSTTPAR